MLDNLYIHNIRVLRWGKTGQNAFGERTVQSSTPANLQGTIPCRIEEYQAVTQYNESNRRGVNKTLVYIPAAYTLQNRDEVTQVYSDGTTRKLGIVDGVNPALLASTTDLDHWEVTIENP